MSEDKKLTQKELMKKYIEEKKQKSNGTQKDFAPHKASIQSTSKMKRSYNGGGFFDK